MGKAMIPRPRVSSTASISSTMVAKMKQPSLVAASIVSVGAGVPAITQLHPGQTCKHHNTDTHTRPDLYPQVCLLIHLQCLCGPKQLIFKHHKPKRKCECVGNPSCRRSKCESVRGVDEVVDGCYTMI
jgi:hypothetical protein